MVPKSPTAARLAVIGGSGFLGAWLVELAQRNPSLAVASLSRDPAWFPRPRAGERFERMEVDALERDELETALLAWKPTHVVLCAALSRMAECRGDPERAHRANVDLPHRVALLCRGRTRLVYVSTDLVFGANAPGPRGFDELATPAPMSDYGRSKLGGESVLRVHARLDPQHLIVRLPLLYGPSFGRELGASDSLFAALERGETPRLFSDERRSPLDVRDAAAALLELALGDHVGLLHVGGPVAIDRYSFGMSALLERGFSAEKARASLISCLRRDAGLDAERPADVVLDSTRARAVLATRLRGPSEALADRGD